MALFQRDSIIRVYLRLSVFIAWYKSLISEQKAAESQMELSAFQYCEDKIGVHDLSRKWDLGDEVNEI